MWHFQWNYINMKEFYQIWLHVCACAHACMCVVLNISIMSSQVLFWLWLLKLVCFINYTKAFACVDHNKLENS